VLGIFGLSVWGRPEDGWIGVVVHSIAIVIAIVTIGRIGVEIIIY
jgi:hypothetical protein